MLSKWPIRNKLLIGIGLLAGARRHAVDGAVSGVYAYRSLVRSLSGRATELPLAAALSRHVGDLRVTSVKLRTSGPRRRRTPAARRRTTQRCSPFRRPMKRSMRRSKQYRDQLVGRTTRTTCAIDDSRDERKTSQDRRHARGTGGYEATAIADWMPTPRG